MKKCPKCSMQVKDTAKFCVYCGFNIKKHEEEYTSPRHFCPECGAEITEGSFCPECGASISEHLGDSKLGGILSDFDFSGLENEAHKQLIEQIGLEIEGSVLVKYTGKKFTI
jgi:predicted amidophosphoribosyltransferase